MRVSQVVLQCTAGHGLIQAVDTGGGAQDSNTAGPPQGAGSNAPIGTTQAQQAQRAQQAQHAQQLQQAEQAQHAQQAQHAAEPQQPQQFEQTAQLQAVDDIIRAEEVASEPHKQSWLSALKPLKLVKKRCSSAEHATARQAVVDVSRADGPAANVNGKTPKVGSKGKRIQKVAATLKRGVGKAIPGCLRAPDKRTDSHADVQPYPAADPTILPQPQPQPQQKKNQGLKSRVPSSSVFAAFKHRLVKGDELGAAQEDSHTLRDQPVASPDIAASKVRRVNTAKGVPTNEQPTCHESEQTVLGSAGSLDPEPVQHGRPADLIRAVRAPSGLADVQQADMQQSDMQQECKTAAIGASVQQVSFLTLATVCQMVYHYQFLASSLTWL